MIPAETRKTLERASAVISLRTNTEFYLTHPRSGTTSYVYRGSTGAVTLSYQESVGNYDKMKVVRVTGRWHYADGSGTKRKMGRGGFIYLRRAKLGRWSDNY